MSYPLILSPVYLDSGCSTNVCLLTRIYDYTLLLWIYSLYTTMLILLCLARILDFQTSGGLHFMRWSLYSYSQIYYTLCIHTLSVCYKAKSIRIGNKMPVRNQVYRTHLKQCLVQSRYSINICKNDAIVGYINERLIKYVWVLSHLVMFIHYLMNQSHPKNKVGNIDIDTTWDLSFSIGSHPVLTSSEWI